MSADNTTNQCQYPLGIDIGSTASKVVARGETQMEFVLPTGWNSKETTRIIQERLKEHNVDVLDETTKVVATGYGRIAVDFADYVITEITCHARGGRELGSDNCGIIDVGGQDTKVILVQNGAECNSIRVLDCETYKSTRYESRV